MTDGIRNIRKVNILKTLNFLFTYSTSTAQKTTQRDIEIDKKQEFDS